MKIYYCEYMILGKNHFYDEFTTNINLGALKILFMKFNPKVSITRTSVKSEWILFYQGVSKYQRVGFVIGGLM